MKEWYVQVGETTIGPATTQHVVDALHQGKISAASLARASNSDAWLPLSSFPEFSGATSTPRTVREARTWARPLAAGAAGGLVIVAAGVAVIAVATNDGERDAEAALSPTGASTASPGASDSGTAVPDAEAPPEPSPTPLDQALSAFDAGEYPQGCEYLVERGFDQTLCDWMIATIEADQVRPLYADRYERFLRRQHVRRVSGRIVGWYDEAHNEYEVRVRGRPAILVMTERAFATTGRFTLWAQSYGTSEEVLASGRETSVPVYREWPLHEQVTEVAQLRRDAGGAARALLREVVRGWEQNYCYEEDPMAFEGCFVEAPPARPDPSSVTPARRRDCRDFICVNYMHCRRAGLPFAECADDITPECRECRQEGAVP